MKRDKNAAQIKVTRENSVKLEEIELKRFQPKIKTIAPFFRWNHIPLTSNYHPT
jgi:hypothetical protein